MLDLHASLKARTADCHDHVERQLGLGNLTCDRAAYIDIIAAFLGFIAPWEAQTEDALPARFTAEFSARRKACWLEHDLAALGVATDDVPRCEPAPPGTSLARLFGAWYVIEGSTLGGRFIAPAAAQRFGLAPGEGNRYFDGYGERTGSQWKAFLALMDEAVGSSPEAVDACVAGARDTFDNMARWFAARGIDARQAAEVAQ